MTFVVLRASALWAGDVGKAWPGIEKHGTLFVALKVQVLSVVGFGPVSSSILVT